MYTTRLPGSILTCTQFTLHTVLSCPVVSLTLITSCQVVLFISCLCSCTLQCLHSGPGRELLRFVGTRERKAWTLTAVVIASTVRSAKREGQRSLWISWKGLSNLPSLTLDEWLCGWLESRTGGGSEKGTSHLCLLREDGEIMVWHAILTPVLVLLSLCPASSSSGRHPGQTRGWWLLLPTMAASEEIQSQKSWGDAKKGEEIFVCGFCHIKGWSWSMCLGCVTILPTYSRSQTPPSHEEKRSGGPSQISWASAHFCNSVT